jgi:glycosyltransferase involved in cell wall biosynthesis
VDPRDVRSIADGIARALEIRGSLRAAGLRRAAELSWERVARETSDVYDSVAARWV